MSGVEGTPTGDDLDRHDWSFIPPLQTSRSSVDGLLPNLDDAPDYQADCG